MTSLYSWEFNQITLEAAIKQCANYLDNAVGLFYSPQFCCFGKLQADATVQNPIHIIALGKVFEARIFSESKQAELRWLNELNGNGKAVLISEQILDQESFINSTLNILENLDTIDQTYVLWGEGTKTKISEGWSLLATARIGKLYVPTANLNDKERVLLRTREYIHVVDDYGNVAVIEECLIGFKRVINLEQDKLNAKD
ncbi:CRISPR-associated protein Csx19 [Nostoc sp. C052]|uniref:type III-D CRISPR-associated protein Csx19 n=1 Tax=Nostoc sp. C052 TaxID=2576902 RepID=UPI0015C3B59B|nr:CRISPR-associated protein Csx19 [Nostoc sp. C052]